jgi:chitinase
MLLACSSAGQPSVGASTPTGNDASSSGSADGSAIAPAPGDSDAARTGDGSTESGAPATGMWVMGYYSAWNPSSYPVSEIDWAGLSHLAVAFYLPTAKGDIDLSASGGQAVGVSLVAAAHAAGKKVLASFGGSSSQMVWQGATSAANRTAFESNIKSLVTTYGFDGVDLDWEPFDVVDHAPLLALAQELRAQMPGALITMPVGCENNNSPDDLSFYKTLAPYLDRMNLMSYGVSGAWQGWKSWHSSPLHWNGDTSTPMGIDSSVDDYLKAGVPPGKLGIGSGFFGECYTSPVTAPDQALGGSMVAASDGTMSYANIVSGYDSPPVRKWDSSAMVPYLSFAAAHGAQGCTYVTYEDEQAIAAKGAYAKSKGLGGVIIWTINEGYIASSPAGQRNPLLEAMKTAFLQ